MQRGFDLASIANDGGIGHQSFDVIGGHHRHSRRVESVKCCVQVVSLVEHSRPRQAILEVCQGKRFEQHGFVVGRPSPFVIVIGGQIAARLGSPTAAGDAVGAGYDGGQLWWHIDTGHRLHASAVSAVFACCRWAFVIMAADSQ